MTFGIGQEVECVDASQTARSGIKFELVLKQVYRVSWAGIFVHPLWGPYYGVSVEGIVRCEPDPIFHLPDVPFLAQRFRPLTKRTTDISVFTEILNRENSKVSA